jgi:hypothetical protein
MREQGAQILRRFVLTRDGSGHSAPTLSTRVLAALWLGICLAPAALGADSSNQKSPDESQLGGWIRMQHLEQVRRGDHDGCNQVVNIFMTFDLVPNGLDLEGLKTQLAAEAARMEKSNVPPLTLEKIQKLSWSTRLAWLAAGGRSATKLRYVMQTDGCHDIGGSAYTCNAPGDEASGEITFGEHTPTGFKQTTNSNHGVKGVGFNPMDPSIRIGTYGESPSSTQGSVTTFLHQFGSNIGVCISHPPAGPPVKSTFIPLSGQAGAFDVDIVPAPACNQGDIVRAGWTGESAYPFCVSPTACFKATDETQRRQCATNPDKFEMVPFEGNQEQHYPAPPALRRRHHLFEDNVEDLQRLRPDDVATRLPPGAAAPVPSAGQAGPLPQHCRRRQLGATEPRPPQAGG